MGDCVGGGTTHRVFSFRNSLLHIIWWMVSVTEFWISYLAWKQWLCFPCAIPGKVSWRYHGPNRLDFLSWLLLWKFARL